MNGCSQKSEEHISDSTSEIFSSVEKIEGTLDYISGLNDKFDKIEKYFIPEKLDSYDCSLIDKYFKKKNHELITKLIKIDSINCEHIFGTYKNDFGDFCSGYWLSYVNQIHNFYPITVIQYYGVVERPIVLVLFDRHGNVVNSLEVAGLYGETGGCLSSKYLNDTTLIRNFEWNEFGVDSITGEELWETEYSVQHATILSSGKIEMKEIKRWKE